MIGLSFSQCVADIANGKVKYEDVEKIITGTRVTKPEDWNNVFEIYRNSVWNGVYDKAVQIAKRLIREGKIEQPKIRNILREPYIIDHKWWVESGEKIRWTA